MKNYIVSFTATINGTETRYGQLGIQCDPERYNPNLIKSAAEKYYRSLDDTKTVAIVIREKRDVTAEEYANELSNNIPIVPS